MENPEEILELLTENLKRIDTILLSYPDEAVDPKSVEIREYLIRCRDGYRFSIDKTLEFLRRRDTGRISKREDYIEAFSLMMRESERRVISKLVDSMNTNQIYETDYDTWLAAQINSLQQGNWNQLDIPHLIEELEGLNKSNERELESYLVVLLAHLLKWEYQPEKRCGSWDGSITNARNRITKLFKQQKSLRKRVAEFIPEAYLEAKEWASKETKLRIDLFPQSFPYSAEQMLDKDWLPK